MNKQTDLLPWIIGGVSIFAVAAAVALVSARPKIQSLPPTLATAQTAPAPIATLPVPQTTAPVETAAPAAPVETAAPMALSTAPSQAAGPNSLPPPAGLQTAAQPPAEGGGQIWECTTNGVKTFSNNPCGDKSTLVAVRTINTMSATPPVRYAHAYPAQPAYSPQPAQQYANQNSSDEDSDSDQDAGYGAGSTAVIGGFAVLPRRVNDHPHRPHPHHYPGPPRKN
jgi:hypothetical protein